MNRIMHIMQMISERRSRDFSRMNRRSETDICIKWIRRFTKMKISRGAEVADGSGTAVGSGLSEISAAAPGAGFDEDLTAKVRYGYMDLVTRRVETDFSMQIGDWCRKHGVQYIGHLIEDNNQHARCGSSLGHFFRGLMGQDMSGIDDIGGQVIPQGEDLENVSHLGTKRDGEFYHFALGRLASSAAAIDTRKQDRLMCEIFGIYGWKEGVRLEALPRIILWCAV